MQLVDINLEYNESRGGLLLLQTIRSADIGKSAITDPKLTTVLSQPQPNVSILTAANISRRAIPAYNTFFQLGA